MTPCSSCILCFLSFCLVFFIISIGPFAPLGTAMIATKTLHLLHGVDFSRPRHTKRCHASTTSTLSTYLLDANKVTGRSGTQGWAFLRECGSHDLTSLHIHSCRRIRNNYNYYTRSCKIYYTRGCNAITPEAAMLLHQRLQCYYTRGCNAITPEGTTLLQHRLQCTTCTQVLASINRSRNVIELWNSCNWTFFHTLIHIFAFCIMCFILLDTYLSHISLGNALLPSQHHLDLERETNNELVIHTNL